MSRFAKAGLIGAMDEEIAQLVQRMEQVRTSEKAGIVFYEGEFLGRPAVLCKSGVGKVNAAVCTQILIDRFQADYVIFTGVAGALDPDLDIGDVVVSTECVHHDMDVTALGFSRGQIPYQDVSVFAADPELIQLAGRAGDGLLSGKTVKGRVLSGDQFIADREKVRELHDQLGGLCTEMEGAAAAQTCVLNHVPFVVIRSMSDRADGSAHVDFNAFTVRASAQSFKIVAQMMKNMY